MHSPPTTMVKTTTIVVALMGGVACSQPPAESPVSATPVSVASENEHWQGVYQGPYHLYLRLRVRGDKSIGYWRAIGGRSGRLGGKIANERFQFAWREEGGGQTAWSGRGYFEFRPAHGVTPPTIYGEWGLGASRSGGGSWWAFKRPDNPSIDGVEDISRDADEDRECPSCGNVDFDDFTRE